MRLAVCTATIGPQSDPLRDPSYVAPGVLYLCASDQPIQSAVWERVPVRTDIDPVVNARRFKIRLHRAVRGADLYVWIDARFTLEIDPHIFVGPMLHHDLCVLPHPFCDTLEQEAAEIARRGLVNRHDLDRQLAHYRKAGCRVDRGPHYSTGVLVRRNDKRTAKFNDAWAEELARWKHTRDQMSFDFMVRQFGLHVGLLQGHYRENPYATWGEAA